MNNKIQLALISLALAIYLLASSDASAVLILLLIMVTLVWAIFGLITPSLFKETSRKKILTRSAATFLVLIAFGVASAASGDEKGGKYKEVGYQKYAKNRIFIIEMPYYASANGALKYARKKMNTAGKFTAVYFYTNGAARIPSDVITLAKDLFAANDILYRTPGYGKWQYAFMRGIAGEEIFVDCVEDPSADLCRKI